MFDAFETARLRLAPLTMQDADALHRLTDDPAIVGVISFLKPPFTVDDAQRLIEGIDGGRHRFAGMWKRGTLVGVLGVFQHDDSHIELGYWIGSAFQGKGYATEALSGAVQALASAEREIFAEARPENLASRRVLAKAGFHATGAPGDRAGRERYVWRR